MRSRSRTRRKVDIAVVLGGDNSFNQLIVQPEIKSLADITARPSSSMPSNTAYAFQLYEMLAQNGLKKGDYEVKVGRRDRPRGSRR